MSVAVRPDSAIPTTPTTATAGARPRRRWPLWVRAAVVPCVLMFGNYAVFLPVSFLLGQVLRGAPAELEFVLFPLLAALVPLTAIAFVVLLMRRVDQRPLREAGLFVDRRSPLAFVIGVLVAAAAFVGATLSMDAAHLLRGGAVGTQPVGVVALSTLILGLVVQGFPEELLWRGYLIQTLPWRSPWAVTLFSAALFGLLHLVSSGDQEGWGERILYLFPAFSFAFLAGALYRATGQLWAAVGVHAGMHFASGTLEYLGFGSGPAAWIAEGVAYCVAAIAIMVWLDRNRPGAGFPGDRP